MLTSGGLEKQMTAKASSKLAPVVAILNMKGGVGKTTISAHVMRVLYRELEKKTLLIDFDPQFNLTQTIVPQATYEKYKLENRTVLSVMEPPPQASLFTVTKQLPPPPELADVSAQIKRLDPAELRLVPGDFGLVKYSLIDDPKSLAPVKNRFHEFVQRARAEMQLVCLDCNPSSSFMTVCALEAATHLIIPVRPDRYSILGLELLEEFVCKLPTLKTQPKQLIVLNGIPRSAANYDPAVENILRSHPKFGARTLSTPLYQSGLLAASPGYTGFASDKRVPHRHRVTANLEELATEIGKEVGITS